MDLGTRAAEGGHQERKRELIWEIREGQLLCHFYFLSGQQLIPFLGSLRVCPSQLSLMPTFPTS